MPRPSSGGSREKKRVKPRFAQCTMPDGPNCKRTAIEACRIAKKRIAVTSVHHQQAICRYGNSAPFIALK